MSATTARHARHSTRGVESARRDFRPDIQALRALAVVLVVLYHAHVPGLSGGYVGVDVFFVISGFLIGGHLLREQDKNGRVRLWRFWGRRIRRLLPASALVIVATLVSARFISAPLGMVSVSTDAKWTSLYLSNLRFAVSGVSYLADSTPSPFQQYWSLALEEQFYVCWPLLLILCLLIGRSRGLALRRWAVAAVVVVSFATSVWLTSFMQPLAFYLLPARAWEFGVGTLVAMFAPQLRKRLNARLSIAMAGIGVVLILVAGFTFSGGILFPGWFAAVPVLGCALVIAGGISPMPEMVAKAVSFRPIQFIGAISYSLYLWHWPLLVVPTLRTGHPLSAPERVGAVLASVALAWVTYRLVEGPFRTWSRLRGAPQRSYAMGAVLTATALAVAFVAAILPTLTSNREALVLPAHPTARQLVATAYVPKNVTPTLQAAPSDQSVLYRDGCQASLRATSPSDCRYGDPSGTSTMVLMGDSHAAQWFPPLNEIAKQRHMKLLVFTKSSCPAASVTVFNVFYLRNYSECDQFRKQALKAIAVARPAVVVISDDTQYRSTVRGARFEALWAVGLKRTLDELPIASQKVIISPTPHFTQNVPTCLSAHLDDTAACSQALDAAAIRRATTERAVAAAVPSVRYVNATPWICPDGVCVTIEGNVEMYTDQQHLTNTYSARLDGVLGAAIQGTE